MEHNTDRILWTVLILAIGIGLYTVFHPAANHLLGRDTEKIQDIATNVDSNTSNSSSSNSDTVDSSSDSDFSYSDPNTADDTISIVRYLGHKENLTIPKYRKIGSVSYKVTAIAREAFFRNTSIKQVTIPDGVTSIGLSAFYKTNVTSVDLPDSLTLIGSNAFAHTPISTISFKTRIALGYESFAYTNLKNVTLPTGSTYHTDSTFDPGVKVTFN